MTPRIRRRIAWEAFGSVLRACVCTRVCVLAGILVCVWQTHTSQSNAMPYSINIAQHTHPLQKQKQKQNVPTSSALTLHAAGKARAPTSFTICAGSLQSIRQMPAPGWIFSVLVYIHVEGYNRTAATVTSC